VDEQPVFGARQRKIDLAVPTHPTTPEAKNDVLGQEPRLITMHSLRSLFLALLPVLVGCTENKYVGTAEQAGAMYLQGCGKQIATAVIAFHREHGKWPSALSDLVREGPLTSRDLLYPRVYELPDRRDILGFTDGIEWIYIPPRDSPAGMPLLIAPLPYTSSMGARLARPRRIIVKADTVPESVEEDEIAKLIQTLTKA